MPQFGKTLERVLGRRWGIRAIDRPKGIVDQVVPVARVDRGWNDDEVHHWGYTFEVASTGANYPSVIINAGGLEASPSDKDCYVRHLRFTTTRTTAYSGLYPGMLCHLSRAFPDYDAHPVNPGEWFPALFPTPSFQFPDARVTTGVATALQSVTIGGVPISPFYGPRYYNGFDTFGGTVIGVGVVRPCVVIDWDDPPLLVNAGTRLMLQGIAAQAGDVLAGEIYLSERDQPRA